MAAAAAAVDGVYDGGGVVADDVADVAPFGMALGSDEYYFNARAA